MTIDYHDFSTKDMPKSARDRYNIGDLWINAATCNKCGDYIRSKNRHDMVSCKCGNVMVDGGSCYAKRNYETLEFENHIELFDDVKGE